ncbi:MAG: tRNA preQ1(34) S-adenosylmethionine ribosyltransferase-isomerase QueA [Acidobacteriota bacterium]|nr:tRNA preQ1(34) S-adenosylmethionine ribosyltransferase-isomerase QueA [Acidobacteriota bacterium]
MRVSDFHFDLPEELIAQHPPAVRGSSRMLVVERSQPPAPPTLTDSHFMDLPQYLRAGDLLIFNDSRVLPSRLFATRAGAATHPRSPAPSGRVEVLLTEQLGGQDDSGGATVWRALCRPARKVVPGETLLFHAPGAEPGASPALRAEVVSVGDFGERTLRFAPAGPHETDFFATVSRIGHMPLPPYIRRDQADNAGSADDEEDRARYQTVYAQDPQIGAPRSAAAPTAGLHFTPEVLGALTARGVEIAPITLHVGLGTFQPVRVAELAEIRLHAERYTLPVGTADALNRALRPVPGEARRRVVAVGTTTTRTLEHIAGEAQGGVLEPHSGSTALFLSPGHRFRIVSGLLTNFHLPESTLLMLVAAFMADGRAAGHTSAPPDADLGRRQVLAAYAHAVAQRYRFFSYGDCMLLL